MFGLIRSLSNVALDSVKVVAEAAIDTVNLPADIILDDEPFKRTARELRNLEDDIEEMFE